MENLEHSSNYSILKNRMTNGTPFLKERALGRIAALANAFDITQTEAEELAAIANSSGVEILPEDALGRLGAVETAADELTLMVADLIGGAV